MKKANGELLDRDGLQELLLKDSPTPRMQNFTELHLEPSRDLKILLMSGVCPWHLEVTRNSPKKKASMRSM